MDKDFLREGSENEGDEVGLKEGEVKIGGDRGCGRGGKSTKEFRDGGACSLLFCGDGECEGSEWSGVMSGGESTGAEGDSCDEKVFAARSMESQGEDRSCIGSSREDCDKVRGLEDKEGTGKGVLECDNIKSSIVSRKESEMTSEGERDPEWVPGTRCTCLEGTTRMEPFRETSEPK